MDLIDIKHRKIVQKISSKYIPYKKNLLIEFLWPNGISNDYITNYI